MITNLVAGTQIRQVGKDHEPIDIGSKKNGKSFMADMGNWREKIAKDEEGKGYGYIDLTSAAVPYATVST